MQNGVVSGQRILISPARQAVRFGRSLLADVLPRPRRPPVFPPSPLRPSATAELRSCAQLSDSDVRKSSFAMSRPLADALPVRALPRNPALAFGCQDRLFRFVLPVLSERGEILGFRSCVYGSKPVAGELPCRVNIQSRFTSPPSWWNCTLVCPPSTKSSILGK